MSSTKIFVTGGLVLVLGAAGWFGYRQSQPVAMVGPIKRGTVVKAVPANILVTAEFPMEIKSEGGGRILTSNVRLGTEVKAGDVLFVIDTKDMDLEIERWEADYEAAKARIELGSPIRFEIATAEETVRNHTRLVEQGKLAQVELDRSKRAVEQAKDRLALEAINNKQLLQNFENTLATKRLQRDRTRTLVAQAGGTIAEINLYPGDLAGGGQILARAISTARLVEAQISEENIAGVRPGLAAKVQLLGYGGKLFNAKVERVLPGADERTKRYKAFLKIDIDEALLAPGLTGEASITIDRHDNTLVAERRSMLGHAVFVVRDGVAHFVPVMIDYANMNHTEIVAGVNEGDLVILSNPAGFRDGQRVRMQLETANR